MVLPVKGSESFCFFNSSALSDLDYRKRKIKRDEVSNEILRSSSDPHNTHGRWLSCFRTRGTAGHGARGKGLGGGPGPGVKGALDKPTVYRIMVDAER